MTSEALKRQRAREATARYRAAHPDRHRASSRAAMARRRAADPEGEAAYAQAYRRAHPDIYSTSAAQRRAAQAPGIFTAEDWMALLDEFGHRCAYCQSPGPLEREHMTPLARGGSHSPQNIVPACATCNRRKGTLTALEFLGRTPPLFSRKEILP